MPGRLSDSQIAGKHPSAIDRRSLSRVPAGATRKGTCRAYVLRPANQLWTLVRFTDQMAAAGMQNGRSHSRPQMCIDTSCDVAKLAEMLAQGRVLEPERVRIPSPAPFFQMERELSTLFSMACKQITRLRTEKPLTGALRAASSIVVVQADRILCRMTDRHSCWSSRQAHLRFRSASLPLSIGLEDCAGTSG